MITEVRVTGLAALAVSHEARAKAIRSRIVAAMRAVGIDLVRRVRRDYLTGRALRVQTGRLRNSINARTEDSGSAIVTTVGTPVVYGRVWELGFEGTVGVRLHMRRVSEKAVTKVRAHQRRIRLAPRPFLRPALEDAREGAVERIAAAAKETP